MRKLKRILAFALAVMLTAGVWSGNTALAKKVKNPIFNKNTVTMTVGKKKAIKIRRATKNQLKKLKWSVSNKKVVIIVEKKNRHTAVIKAIHSGNAVVRAKIAGKTLRCRITVKERTRSNNIDNNVTKERTVSVNDMQNEAVAAPVKILQSEIAATVEEPGKTSEVTDKTTEEPGKTNKEPGKTTEEPDKTTEEPGKTTEEPGKTTEEPGKTTEEPDKTTEEPGKTTEEPDKTTESPVHKHYFGEKEVMVEPTCVKAGKIMYTCSCGETKSEEIPMNEHAWIISETVGDCTTKTVTTKTCSVCGNIKTEDGEYVHSKILINGNKKEVHKICSTCGAIVEDGSHHKFTEKSTATCTESGTITYTCDCGYTYTKDAPALGHDYDTDGICKRCYNAVNKENVKRVYDVSEAKDHGIVMYTLDEDNDGFYECYIKTMKSDSVLAKSVYSDDFLGKLDKKYIEKIVFLNKTYANEDSNNLFSEIGYANIKSNSIDIKDRSDPVGIYYLKYLDTSKVKNMECMFSHFYGRKVSGQDSIPTTLDVSNFDTKNVENMEGMFNGCSALLSLDVSNFDTKNVENMKEMFDGCSALNSLNVTNFDTGNVKSMYSMFGNCSSLSSLDVTNFDTKNVENMLCMFYYCKKLKTIDVSNFSTNKVKSMGGMFEQCIQLESLDLNSFSTGNVVDFSYMFENCTNLKTLNISSFDTSKAETMNGMFRSCENLESIDVSNFNTKNVIEMIGLFQYCVKLKSVNVSNFDTSNVTKMKYMFAYCNTLKELDLSNFNTSNVTNMEYMFAYCNTLRELDLSNFNTSNATNMEHMFSDCSSLTILNLTSFDTSKAKNMSSMFSYANRIDDINVSKGKWMIPEECDINYMFKGCGTDHVTYHNAAV